MSLAQSVLSYMKLGGVVFGGYSGYMYGNRIVEWSCKKYPQIKRYREIYIKPHFSQQEELYNLIGAFTGILCGYHAWMIIIPIGISSLKDTLNKDKKKDKKK